MIKRSIEQQNIKRGILLYLQNESYWQFISEPGGSLLIPPLTSLPSTGLATPPRSRWASLPRRPRFLWSSLSRTQPWSWTKGHLQWLPKTIIEATPHTDAYWLQGVFCKACGINTDSSDSASLLEAGQYNEFRETSVLGVYEWEQTTQLAYTMEGYNRCRHRKRLFMLSHEWKLYRPDSSNKDQLLENIHYKCSTRWQVRCSDHLGGS